MKKIKGLSATRNTGAAIGDAELVAFLDGDMTVENDWIKSFLPYFDKSIIGVMGDNIPSTRYYFKPNRKILFGGKRGARQFGDGDYISFQYMLYGNAMIKRSKLLRLDFLMKILFSMVGRIQIYPQKFGINIKVGLFFQKI